jgi:hypothetical protein
MDAGRMSLRLLVDKWLAPTLAMPARVARCSRLTSSHGRYVCIEALRPSGTVVIFFFRHGDGAWRVFPPSVDRPAMRAC